MATKQSQKWDCFTPEFTLSEANVGFAMTRFLLLRHSLSNDWGQVPRGQVSIIGGACGAKILQRFRRSVESREEFAYDSFYLKLRELEQPAS